MRIPPLAVLCIASLHISIENRLFLRNDAFVLSKSVYKHDHILYALLYHKFLQIANLLSVRSRRNKEAKFMRLGLR